MSLKDNADFASLFQIDDVDWDAVKHGMIAERDIFPTELQDLKIRHLEKVLSIVKEFSESHDGAKYKEKLCTVLKQAQPISTPSNRLSDADRVKIMSSKENPFIKNIREGEQAQRDQNYDDAIVSYVKTMYVELSGSLDHYSLPIFMNPDGVFTDLGIDRCINRGHKFPYAKSSVRLGPGLVSNLRTCKNKLELERPQLEVKVSQILADYTEETIKWHLFTKEECAQIIICEVYKEPVEIAKIYDTARQRILDTRKAVLAE